MELWQLLVTIIGVILVLSSGVFGYLKWRDDGVAKRATHRQISEHNREILTNHLQHHEGCLEPWMRQISQDIGILDGKVDILVRRSEDD